MIQKKIKISDFPLLNKVLTKGKTIVAHNKKNYSIELDQIKGDKIKKTSEIEANPNEGERKNVIKLDFDNGQSKYFVVYNGEDGDKGKTGKEGEQGLKGNPFNKQEMIKRGYNPLVIVNDDETNDPTSVWSAYRGKVMELFLKSLAERIITDDEYQLLFNNQVFIDLEFTTNKENQAIALVHNDTKDFKTYVKYWTYEDDGNDTFFIKIGDNYEQVKPGFDIWKDFYLNTEDDTKYYTRKLVITGTDPITGEITSSEYQYTEITKPIWLNLEFTTIEEDQKSILLSNRYGDEDPTDISKDKEDEVIVLHRPITSISIEGNDHIRIPINSILTKGVIIQPTDYLNSPICIEYDESKIEVFEDGRIMALENNCETVIKIYSEENPNIYANIYVNVYTNIDNIQFNFTDVIKGFPGSEKQIVATIYPDTASNKVLEWESSDENIATVDQDGKVTLKDVGTARISAKSTDGSDIITRIDVRVEQAIEDIIFSNPKYNSETQTCEILIGIPTIINATILPENASNKELIWSTEDENINIGVAPNNIDGQIYINNKNVEKPIIVKAVDGSPIEKIINIIPKTPIRTINLNTNYIELDKGETFKLSAIINSDADNQNIIWSSDNTNIARVDQTGNIITIGGGDVTITATAEDGSGVFATCDVKSVVLIEYINFKEEFKNSLKNLHVGNTYVMLKDDIYEINNDANVTKLNWYTSNNDIVEVNSDNAGITIIPKKAGKAKIYAAATDNSGIIQSTNINITISTEELLLSNNELTLNVDQSYTLIATVVPDDTSLQNVEFISLDPTIASVDQNGIITGEKVGNTSIIVKTIDGTNLSSICEITVE